MFLQRLIVHLLLGWHPGMSSYFKGRKRSKATVNTSLSAPREISTLLSLIETRFVSTCCPNWVTMLRIARVLVPAHQRLHFRFIAEESLLKVSSVSRLYACMVSIPPIVTPLGISQYNLQLPIQLFMLCEVHPMLLPQLLSIMFENHFPNACKYNYWSPINTTRNGTLHS